MSDRKPTGRSLWQVLGLYAAVAWVSLQVVDVLTQNIALPSWVFVLTLGLLVAGLPVTVATAYLQNQARAAEQEPLGAGGLRGLFTWGNVVRGGIGAMAVWGVAVTGWLVLGRDASGEWDVVAGLQEIERLTNDSEYRAAYDVAAQLDEGVTNDSVRVVMWDLVSRTLTIQSQPEGARVWRRDYGPLDAPWEELGVTPVTIERFPFGRSRVRLEADGFQTLEVARSSDQLAEDSSLQMVPEGDLPDGMVPVAGGEVGLWAPGLEQQPILELGDYLMGALEVTNAEFKEFVDAGGYADPSCWVHPFEEDGRTVPRAEAMDRLTDRTGRPGPSTWEVGTYQPGTGDQPVGGVSWYEAEAYACWRGMALPTVYHWYREADPMQGGHAVPLSNFGEEGPAPAGSYGGMTHSGTLDMAGNVREWTRNSNGSGRFILGGGWADPRYAFNDAVTSPPFDRDPANGLRLVQYLDSLNLDAAGGDIEAEFRDYTVEQPVSDEVFDVFRQLHDYDRTPLNTEVVSTDTTDLWIRERIDLDAAYDGPRLTVFVFVPRTGAEAHQPIVYFPGSNDIYRRDYEDLAPFDFLIQSGRAFVYPAYLGTWERETDLNSDVQNETALYRDHVVAWGKDFRRTLDYLETRSDMRMDAVGYFGFSWGGAMAPIVVALEDRVRAAALMVPGLMMQATQPSVDPLHFLPRVTVPTLMYNGRYDSFFPVEASIQPFFRLLGTPEDQKRMVVADGNHFVWSYSRNELIREVLDWYDRWLGAVE